MQTYFFSNGINIKIGKSEDVPARKRNIEAGIYEAFGLKWELETLLVLDGDHESDLHLFFAEDRVGGEWFYPSEKLRTFIEEAVVDSSCVSIPQCMLNVKDGGLQQRRV